MKIKTIAFDGDDTLWHHENYFSEARQKFNSLMNELGDFPNAGEVADAQHISNLPLWGYGVRSFTLSMIEAAISMTNGSIDGNNIKHIMEIGRSLYQHPVILLDHVAETIQELQTKYRLVLITKGDLVAQEIKISQSKLGPFFETIEIVSEKDVETYQRIFKRHGINPKECIMVGNSVKSDIIPPVQLGAQAVHIPYHSTWLFERAEVAQTDQGKFIVLPTMKELVSIIERFENSDRTSLAEIHLPEVAN
jgi:putative hydrolase of the HAD superfamily